MDRLQLIAILFSLALTGYLLWYIRSQRIKVEYAVLWLAVSFVFLLFSSWRQGLELLGDLLGIAYAPAALFMIMLLGIMLILIQFSMIISKFSDQTKRLAQEAAMLQERVRKLEEGVHEAPSGYTVPGTDSVDPASENV